MIRILNPPTELGTKNRNQYNYSVQDVFSFVFLSRFFLGGLGCYQLISTSYQPITTN